MNEQPKNIWRQPWRGSKVLLWFALLAGATFLIVCVIGLLGPGNANVVDTVLGALVISLCFAVAALLALLFIRWLCCWRNFKRFLFGLACLATLFALFHVVENIRGRAAWRKLQQEAAAKNEPLDLASVIPPAVPDAENFAMAPIFEGLRNEMDPEWQRAHTGPGGLTNPHPFSLMVYRTNGSQAGLSVGGWQKAERTDLALWQRYYRDPKWDGESDTAAGKAMRYGLGPPPTNANQTASAPVVNEFPTSPRPQSPAADVLLALSKYDLVVEELRVASQRPQARFPIHYEEGFNALLPHLAKMKGACQLLALRAIAELASSRPGDALEDIKLSFRLADSIREEPILISQLVRLALLQITLQPVWEGLVDHKWNEAQLVELEKELAKMDLLSDYQRGLRGERAFSLWAVDFVRRHGDLSTIGSPDEISLYSRAPLPQRLFFRLLVPGGWFDQNKVALTRIHLDHLQEVVSAAEHTVSPKKAEEMDRFLHHSRMTPYNFFSRMLVPALARACARAALAQTSVDEARVACVLERHRLAHGSYPESLEALLAEYLHQLPQDVINGQPLKYRRADAGSFLLYSVGWNEADEDGKVELTKKGAVAWEEGDWVWPSAAR